jgi:pimeloyl-ACP methyl ester carboxylesterase
MDRIHHYKPLRSLSLLTVCVILITTGCSAATRQAMPIVIVHGAWYDSQSWSKVTPLLEANGHSVTVPDMPGYGKNIVPYDTITFESYLNEVKKAVSKYPGKVLLVGNSLGGTYISQTAEQMPDRIAGLVYVCAFMLRNGESRISVVKLDPQSLALKHRRTIGKGLLTYEKAHFADIFFNDCDQEDIERELQRVKPQPVAPVKTPLRITQENYGRVPRFYVRCLLDRAITPAFQDIMIMASPVRKVFDIEASHSPFISRPAELADIILRVVRELEGSN